jgi:hypothetical protein
MVIFVSIIVVTVLAWDYRRRSGIYRRLTYRRLTKTTINWGIGWGRLIDDNLSMTTIYDVQESSTGLFWRGSPNLQHYTGKHDE